MYIKLSLSPHQTLSILMQNRYLSLFLLWLTATFALAQSEQRINIASITPSENTGQHYSAWLNDDLSVLVPDVWQNNLKWVDVKLQLSQKARITRLSFYDYQGVFSDKPASIFALNGTQKTYLGKFEGLTYMNFVDLVLPQAIEAEAIIIQKFGNNIPQKVKIFGYPIAGSGSAGGSNASDNRLRFTSITASENTGMDYSPWLSDDLNQKVANVWQNNNKWVDVTLQLERKAQLYKLSLYDFEGVFSDNPASIFAKNGSQLTLIGVFDGSTYMNWIHYTPAQPVLAEAVVVRKFGNNIPQKINAYGEYLPQEPAVPERLKITAALPSENTGMDYTPWLNDDLNSLVQSVWQNNSKWVDVRLPFEKRSRLTKVSLYDHAGVFTANPASIFAYSGNTLTLLGVFEGLTYMQMVDIVLPQALEVDGLVVRKFGNDIPQKVFAYGFPLNIAPPPPPNDPPNNGGNPPSGLGAKIAIDPKRWYQLDHVDKGLDGLFDGNVSESVHTGWGRLLTRYESYYPLLVDEEMTINGIKMYDGAGVLSSTPLTISVITDNWQRIDIGTFKGESYNQWVGPDPTNPTNYTLNVPISGTIRYLLLSSYGGFPNEIELYGTHKTSSQAPTRAPQRAVKFKNGFGINAFEWDFLNTYDGAQIDEAKVQAARVFSGFRHYMDWDKLEHVEGRYSFNPTTSGGWDYDAVYTRCKAEGIEVLACLQTMPPWLVGTYPADMQYHDNIPMRYGRDASQPTSYLEQAKVGFQYAARYGQNTLLNPALVSVWPYPRWTHDRVNEVKIGLGLVKYIECGNERDKWWQGRKAYQTAREYAANLSAFYDGHKNTLGPGVGVKNADPSMKVVMTGLASASTDYLRGMIDWCKQYRGYRPDGSVDVCWDVVNYHYYSNDANQSQSGSPTRGAAPEVSKAADVADEFVQVAHRELNNMPVWLTELGYDANQGSPLKAIPIGAKSEYLTQADWNLRSGLLYNRMGIDRTFFFLLYDDNFPNPTQFASMGFINSDKTRKPTADYIYQATRLIGEYEYRNTLSKDPVVDRYELNGQSAYVMYVPDEKARTATYTLDLGNVVSAQLYSPRVASDTMSRQVVATVNGKLTLSLSETPIFVIPFSAGRQALESLSQISVYPNPATRVVHIELTNEHLSEVQIRLYPADASYLAAHSTLNKTEKTLRTTLDISHLPFGLYALEVVQGQERVIRKIIKVQD